MLGNHYTLQEGENELLKIEKDLAAYLNVPFVKCEYDAVNSHKYQDKHEVKYREICAKETECWDACDYIINYELYKTKDDYDKNGGGYDGEVHELLYLLGNGGSYIVITGGSEIDD